MNLNAKRRQKELLALLITAVTSAFAVSALANVAYSSLYKNVPNTFL